MNIEYSYEIVRADAARKNMEVLYTAPGRTPARIGMRMPWAGESLEAVIRQHAPITYWLEQAAAVEAPALGAKGVITPPEAQPRTLEQAKLERLEELAFWRFQLETSGIMLNGARIKTDRESQATITGAFISLSQGLATEIDWKAEGNVWVKLTLPEITAIAQAVVAHVQSAFTAESVLAAEIRAAESFEALEAITFPEILA